MRRTLRHAEQPFVFGHALKVAVAAHRQARHARALDELLHAGHAGRLSRRCGGASPGLHAHAPYLRPPCCAGHLCSLFFTLTLSVGSSDCDAVAPVVHGRPQTPPTPVDLEVSVLVCEQLSG